MTFIYLHFLLCVCAVVQNEKTKVFFSNFQSAASACICGTRLNKLWRINIVERENKADQ